VPGRDDASPPDPFEHGFEVAQRRRLALPPVDVPPEPGGRWQRPARFGWRVVVALLAIVVLLGIGRAMTARNSTGLKSDCSRVQLALGDSSVASRSSTLLHWAATAPVGTKFVVAINARTLDATTMPPTATPATGTQTQVGPVQTMGSGCLTTGQFGVLMPPGHYDVTLFRLDGTQATPVATRPVTVTSG
jgi:hypothetical protein